MNTDDPLDIFIPLIASTVFICLLSTVPLPLFLLVIVIGTMTFVMQTQVYHTRSLAKEFWLSVYLRPDSPVRELLMGVTLLRWIAVAIAAPLAIVTYITVYGYDLWDCLAVAFGIAVARLIHTSISAPINANLAEHLTELAHLRVQYWLAIVAVLSGLAFISVAKGLFSDYSQFTSDQLATQTIEAVKHPVKIVQHCARTLRYSELQLLRIRDINGWPYGWLMYFFFLIPNALPAFGLVTLYSGAERLAKEWIKDA